jgi:molybdopterin biosynthesis enzyme
MVSSKEAHDIIFGCRINFEKRNVALSESLGSVLANAMFMACSLSSTCGMMLSSSGGT